MAVGQAHGMARIYPAHPILPTSLPGAPGIDYIQTSSGSARCDCGPQRDSSTTPQAARSPESPVIRDSWSGPYGA